MGTESLTAALQQEHREIDAGIAAFSASPGDAQPLIRAIRALRRHIYQEVNPEPEPAAPEAWPYLCRRYREPGSAQLKALHAVAAAAEPEDQPGAVGEHDDPASLPRPRGRPHRRHEIR